MKFSNVLFQVEIPAKAFSANGTLKGLLFVVGVHVKGEVVHLVKSLVAYVAFVSFLTRVGQFVVLVVALLMKTFSTKLANPWFVTLVDAHMGVQRRRPYKEKER